MTLSRCFIKLIVLAAFATAAISGVAASASLQISADDEIVWLNSKEGGSNGERTFSATVYCEGGYTSGVEMEILKNGRSIHNSSTDKISYSFPQDEKTGEYRVNATCFDGSNNMANASETFNVAEMKMEILSPQHNENIYRRHFMGEETDSRRLYEGKPVNIGLNLTGEPADYSPEDRDFTFDTRIADYNNPSGGLDYNFEIKSGDESDYSILLHPFIPDDVPGGHHKITVDAAYDSDDGSFVEPLETSDRAAYLPGIRARSINPSKNILYGEVEDINLELFVEDYYRQYQISEDDFKLRVEGKDYENVFELKENADEDGVYSLDLNTVPDLPTEKGSFDIDILFRDSAKGSEDSFIEIASYSVTSKVAFEGYVRDSGQNPVKTNFKVTSGDQYVQFSTENGYFSKQFEPGNKTLTAEFYQGGKVKAGLHLKDVQMEPKYKSRLDFDYRSDPSIDIPGVDAINMMSVAFGHPFRERGSEAMMKFDAAGVDFTQVDVFECQKWNFEGRSCLSGWEKIDESLVTQQPLQYKLEFPVNPLSVQYFNNTEKKVLTSSYVIGARAGLGLQSGLTVSGPDEDGRMPAGNKLSVKGRIVSGGGSGVPDVNVTVSRLEDGSVVETFSDTTDSEGFFEAKTRVKEAGNYTLKMEASHKNYEGFQTEGPDVWTYRYDDISLRKIDDKQPEITIGEPTELALKLENTGSTELTDIEIAADDLEQYISFSGVPEKLPEDGKKAVTMEIQISEEYCNNGCDTIPNVKVTASGSGKKEKVDDTVEYHFVLNTTSSSASSSKGQKSNGVDLSADDVPGAKATGEFFAAQSPLNIALGLVFVLLMTMAGALKKKDPSRDEVRREVMPGKLSGNVRNPRPQGQTETTSDGKVDEEVEKLADSMEEDQEAGGEEESDESGGSDGNVCSTCGEEFDTGTGLELHVETVH